MHQRAPDRRLGARRRGLDETGEAAVRDCPSMTASWELLGQRPGPIGYLSVVTNTYRLPDGSVADWDILAVPDSVAVPALTGDNQVVLVRQYRPGPDAGLDDLPGGMIDAGESPRDAAVRELREGTGYRGDVSIVGYTFVAANSRGGAGSRSLPDAGKWPTRRPSRPSSVSPFSFR